MKLTQLAAKPKLIKIEINDEETVTEFGEAIDFWIYDRQPIDQFIRLAQMKDENMAEIIDIVKKMVLDENGEQVLKDDQLLPTKVLTKVIGRVVETLGK